MGNLETLKTRVKELLKDNYFTNEYGGIEIYTDYRDRELSNDTLYKIMNSDNPRETFLMDYLDEWADNYAYDYGYSDLFNCIKTNLIEEETELYEENEDEMRDWIHENYYFYYDSNDFNTEVKVNLMLDTGDLNYDFTCNNVLNWDGQYSEGEFKKDSSILWLARQMGKETELREACKRQFKDDGYYVDRELEKDPFIESVVQELENLPTHMSTLTFLLSMDLFEYFDLREAMKKEKKLNDSYYYEERKGTGYITISKDTMCGLFNPWNGGGSVLEIKLDKDLQIPIKAIWAAEIETNKSKYGYSVNDVYGLIGSAWNGKVKEIKSM